MEPQPVDTAFKGPSPFLAVQTAQKRPMTAPPESLPGQRRAAAAQPSAARLAALPHPPSWRMGRTMPLSTHARASALRYLCPPPHPPSVLIGRHSRHWGLRRGLCWREWLRRAAACGALFSADKCTVCLQTSVTRRLGGRRSCSNRCLHQRARGRQRERQRLCQQHANVPVLAETLPTRRTGRQSTQWREPVGASPRPLRGELIAPSLPSPWTTLSQRREPGWGCHALWLSRLADQATPCPSACCYWSTSFFFAGLGGWRPPWATCPSPCGRGAWATRTAVALWHTRAGFGQVLPFPSREASRRRCAHLPAASASGPPSEMAQHHAADRTGIGVDNLAAHHHVRQMLYPTSPSRFRLSVTIRARPESRQERQLLPCNVRQ